MSQNFNKLLGSSIIKNDRATINENFDAIRSAHSGTVFPTQELIAGMEFFNTTTKKLYRLQPDLSTWILELDLSSGTAVVAKASSADAAGKASKDANGKDISTYIAKLESDANNAFVINFYDGNNNKLGSVTIPETKVEIMAGASSSSAGKAGLVPQPKAGDNDKFLCGDGSFKEAGKVKSVNGKTGDVVVGEIVDASISGKTITLTFADGTTKTLTTQDTVNNGTVTEKFNYTVNLAAGETKTQTISGLTPYKPVFIEMKKNQNSGSNANLLIFLLSGVALIISSDVATFTASSTSKETVARYVFVPNATSISIRIKGNSSVAVSGKIIMYQ